MSIITNTQHDILKMVSAGLFYVPMNISEETDWQAILLEAKQQAVVPIVFSAAEPHMPKEVLGGWKQYVNHVLANNMRVEWEHTQLHELMTAAGVPYVVIKGSASSSYYPEPILRTMGDVDFFVKEEDLERAGMVLQAAGFVRIDKINDHHIAYHRSAGGRVSTWEMHWKPVGLPDGRAGEILLEHMADVIDLAELKKTSGGSYLVPNVFHHGLILLMHTVKHLVKRGIGLRHLCDWAVFVNCMSDREFIDIFEVKLRAAGLWRFAQLLTAVAAKYLLCRDIQWAANADETLIEAIMADIFISGNFGKKNPERAYEAMLMMNSDIGTVSDAGFFRQFCRNINDRAKLRLPVTKRYPILLPAGWAYVGGRHIFRSLRGLRPKLIPGKTLKGAAERKEIYKEFHLFEVE